LATKGTEVRLYVDYLGINGMGRYYGRYTGAQLGPQVTDSVGAGFVQVRMKGAVLLIE
jgi:hypothetical protein